MSATPEMKFERLGPSSFHLRLSDGTLLQITGPSREAVAQKILAMEQVVGALRHMEWCANCAQGGWEGCEGGQKALAALTAYEGGGK